MFGTDPEANCDYSQPFQRVSQTPRPLAGFVFSRNELNRAAAVGQDTGGR
jgi:hypothetical protein